MTTIVGWHWAHFGVVALGLLSATTLDGMTAGRRLVAAGVFVVLGAAYALLVLPRPFDAGPPAMVYLAMTVVGTGLACGLHPALSLLLFIVYPQAWLFSRSLRRGVLIVAALTVSAIVGFLSRLGLSWETALQVVPSMLVSLGFSLLLGWWVTRIIDQSRERATLIAELDRTREALGEAHHAQGVATERERMAREIHDTLAQGFTSIITLTQAAQAAAGSAGTGSAVPEQVLRRLAAIEDVARENLAEARALVAAFSPVALDGATLADALQRLAARFAAETGLPVEVDVPATPPVLDRDDEVVLLRVAQEALANVRRHAQARRVVVRLATDLTGTRVEVDDDGVGFAPESTDPGTPRRGYGLAGMRIRVAQVGGEVDVTSAPGEGTTVRARVPQRVAGRTVTA